MNIFLRGHSVDKVRSSKSNGLHFSFVVVLCVAGGFFSTAKMHGEYEGMSFIDLLLNVGFLGRALPPAGALSILAVVGWVIGKAIPSRRHNASWIALLVSASVFSVFWISFVTDKTKYDDEVKAIELRHPELNPDLPGFRKDLIQQVLKLKEANEVHGDARYMALRNAVSTLEEEWGKDVSGNFKQPAVATQGWSLSSLPDVIDARWQLISFSPANKTYIDTQSRTGDIYEQAVWLKILLQTASPIFDPFGPNAPKFYATEVQHMFIQCNSRSFAIGISRYYSVGGIAVPARYVSSDDKKTFNPIEPGDITTETVFNLLCARNATDLSMHDR
jgi:hypothetical protein